MRVKYQESIEYKMLNRLKTIRGSVVLRKDFNDIAEYRQISRALKKLIAKKVLVKISTGVYAKAYISKYSNFPLIKNGADSTFRKALRRLKVDFESGSAEKAYNEGKSTQVPAQNVVRLKSRCRRRISYGSSELIFENNLNASKENISQQKSIPTTIDESDTEIVA
jgi:hypothetical protein